MSDQTDTQSNATTQRSVEIRWFFEVPPFNAGEYFGEANQQSQRTDWYATGVAEGCGIKTREGKIETKLLASDLGVRSIARVRGRVGEWIKWSAPLQESAPIPDRLLEINGWVPVVKRRYLRTLEVNSLDVTEAAGTAGNGCQFEWAEIFVRQAKFWTVGFEAFGQPSELWTNLQSSIEYIVKQGLPTAPFEKEASSAYPRWLNRFDSLGD